MNPPEHKPVRFRSCKPTPQETPVSIGDWVLTLIVLGIPVVNIILYVYWALSDSTAPSKKNYCRACILIVMILSATGLLFGIIAAAFAAAFAAAHCR